MADYDLIQDVNYGQKPKETKETSTTEAHDSTTVAKAIEHGRPDALGSKGAMHLQRTAGNAAVGALVQRAGEGEAEADHEHPVQKVVNGGGGTGLDAGVRSKMESSLGHDFGGVKVHTDDKAAAAAKSVSAQAFTVGNNVVFNQGKYDPGTSDGQRIIAHELTHVVQQSRGDVAGESKGGGIKVSTPSDPFEQQAEATADAVMSGGAPAVQRAQAGGDEVEDESVQSSVQREAEEVEGDEAEEEGDTAQALAETNVQREEEDEAESEEG